MKNSRHQTAFTLLEVLMSISLITVIAGSLYATLHISFKSRDAAMDAVEGPVRAELSLEKLRTNFESAVIPRGLLAGPFMGEDEVADSGEDSDALMFHCVAPGTMMDEQRSDIQVVEIICQEEEEGNPDKGMMLLRRVTQNSLASTEEEPEEEVLCRGIHSMNIRYFDGLDWVDSWDSTTEDDILPSAVEITLQLRSKDEPVETEARQTEDNSSVEGYLASRVFLVPCSTIVAGQAPEGEAE